MRGFELGSPNPKSAMLTSQPQIYKNCSLAVFKLNFQTFVDNKLQKKLNPGLDKTQKEIVIKFLVHYLHSSRGATYKSD